MCKGECPVTINPNCWNEHDELKAVMLCPPSIMEIPNEQTAADVRWEKPAHPKKAMKNYKKLVRAFEQEGVHILNYTDDLSEQDQALSKQLIDRFFVRDLACVFGEKVIPGTAGTTIRKPEYIQAHKVFQSWFAQETFLQEETDQKHPMEFGDILIVSQDAVLINVGLRTAIESVEKRKHLLFEAGFSELGIVDLPRTPEKLHLDMNCNMVGSDVLLAKTFMKFFPVQRVTSGGSEYCMLDEFMKRFGIEVVYSDHIKNTVADVNFFNLNPETLLVSKQMNPKILRMVKDMKKHIIKIDVEELEKGGGGIRCMTLPLIRSS